MQSSYPPPPNSTMDPPAYTDADAEQLWPKPSPPLGPVTRLPLPICVPQLTAKYDSIFARAYCPELAAAQISMDEWLKFCDGLNIAIIASPPLRIVDKAGMIIGFVPYHWAMIAGAVMQTASQTAMHVLSKTLTDRYLRRANAHFFAPRGLRVRLCKTPAMRQLIGLDSPPSQPPSKTSQFAHTAGRTAENIALRLPIPFLGRIVESISRPVPHISPNASDVTTRRLASLAPYASPLDFNVPPATPPESLLDKASGLAVKLDTYKAHNSQAKADRKRRLLAIREGQPVSGPAPSSGGLIGSVLGGNRRNGRRERKAGRRAGRDERKGRVPSEHGASARRLRGAVAKADRIEYNATEALLWIVVLNADQDTTIEGTELADSNEDREIVDEDEWEDELELEDEEEEAYVRAEKDGPPVHEEESFSKTYYD